MCQYCDVRMPDASGLEMDGKHHLMRILIAESGHITVRADGLSVPAPKLNESDDDNVKWIIPSDYEMRLFSDEVDAIERCEELMDNEYEEVELYRVRIESKKRCRLVSVWD